MSMHRAQCTIKGITPLLMHRFPLEPVEKIEMMAPEKQAELSCYRDPKTGQLYIPGVNIQRALVSAASYTKGRGRSTMQRPVAACVIVTPEKVLLGTKTFEIDARPIVVPATKGRVVRYRARLEEWEAAFVIDFDNTLITADQLRQVVDDMGLRVGLLDYRPEKKGPFGRCEVVKWSTPK